MGEFGGNDKELAGKVSRDKEKVRPEAGGKLVLLVGHGFEDVN